MLSQDSPPVVTPHAHDNLQAFQGQLIGLACVPRRMLRIAQVHTHRVHGPMACLDAHWYGHQCPAQPIRTGTCAWPGAQPACKWTGHARSDVAYAPPDKAHTPWTSVNARRTRASDARCVAHAHAPRPHYTQHRACNPHTHWHAAMCTQGLDDLRCFQNFL